MERSLKKYEKEFMKMAMLKQEETFRHQVHELHRLYRVQKLLMRDTMKRQRASAHYRPGLERWIVENERGSNQPCYSSYLDQRKPHDQTLDLEVPAEECIGKDDGDTMLEAKDESYLELTLAIGSSRRQRKKEEASFTSDSGVSFSSSSSDSGAVKLNGQEWGLCQVPGITMSFQDERKSGFSVEERMGQDGLKQPPWLFQCLNLNMT
ncbi:uncharacterized protein LOC103705278 [Phoenix dactylifera]|uniref:Uncharacterized protein LOC103705278 n=1 Tax=Phoenix dactylifera TaxID=42345 RepID=A0A8B7BX48_PHODC|nr:uncharacterized protein LOC103705278 [Phoenix dactylifera]